VQDYEELEEDLNNLNDDDLEPHLTKQDYEKSLDLESLFNNDENINNLGDSTYKGLADSIMVELQHKYDLRPREKSSTNIPPKIFYHETKQMRQQLQNHQLRRKLPEQSKLKQKQYKLRSQKIQKLKFRPGKLKNQLGLSI
jgi:hypothetical protein